MAALQGDLLVLGASGKMGPSLARLARRASDQAGVPRRVIGVARFGDRAVRDALESGGTETIACDVTDRAALAGLPDCPNVVLMVGRKFGTVGEEPGTWATNVMGAALAAERFAAARMVAFSTGNVYPLVPTAGGGSKETDPVGPVGEYACSALGRERVLEHLSARHGTRSAILRLNYAVEPRYGVLRDVADRVFRGEPVALGMGHVNVIWQRDAVSVALRAFAQCTSPPLVLNVTGPGTVAVRDIASRFGREFGREPRFTGSEAPTALLSDASRCVSLFGVPSVPLEEMVARVAEWMRGGGRSLGMPTHFEEREGGF